MLKKSTMQLALAGFFVTALGLALASVVPTMAQIVKIRMAEKTKTGGGDPAEELAKPPRKQSPEEMALRKKRAELDQALQKFLQRAADNKGKPIGKAMERAANTMKDELAKIDAKLKVFEDAAAKNELDKPSARELGDPIIAQVYIYASKLEDQPQEERDQVARLVRELDNEDIAQREKAEGELVLIGKDALREVWRMRKAGTDERRGRVRRMLEMLIAPKPYVNLLALASGLDYAEAQAMLSGNAKDLESLLGRLNTKRIAKHTAIWAMLVVSAKDQDQARTVLKLFRESTDARMIDLFFAMVKEHPLASGKVVESFVEELAVNADQAQLLEMAEHSIKHGGTVSKSVFTRLAKALDQNTLPKRFVESKDSSRREVFLELVRLEDESPLRAKWAGLFPEVRVEERPRYFAMVQREGLSEALASIVELAPTAMEIPELLTQLATAEGWHHALKHGRSIAASASLLNWLPYSVMSLEHQRDVLLSILDKQASELRYEAAEMLRSYGSPLLGRELVKRYAERPEDRILLGLLARHAPFLEEGFADKHGKTIYPLLSDMAKVDWATALEADKRAERIWALTKSPFEIIARRAIIWLINNRPDARSRFCYALVSVNGLDPFVAFRLKAEHVASSDEETLAIFNAVPWKVSNVVEPVKAEKPADGEEAAGDAKVKADEAAAKAKTAEVLNERIWEAPLNRISHKFRRLVAGFALSMAQSSDYAALLDKEPKQVADYEQRRALIGDAKGLELREKLLKENPAAIGLMARSFNALGEEALVVDALMRLIKLRMLGAVVSNDAGGLRHRELVRALLHPSQSEHVSTALLELTRQREKVFLPALLSSLSQVGSPSDYHDTLDACIRRLQLSTQRKLVIGAAIGAKEIKPDLVKRMRRVIGKEEGTLSASMRILEVLSDPSLSLEARETKLMDGLDPSHRDEVLRGLAVRGNRVALNAVCAAIMLQGDKRDLLSLSHLFEGMDPNLGLEEELNVWDRSRYCWRYDADKGVYQLKEQE